MIDHTTDTDTVCVTEGCGRPRMGRRRYCGTCYGRIRRYGSPDTQPSTAPLAEHDRPTAADTWTVIDEWRITQLAAGVSTTVVAQRFSHVRHLAEAMQTRRVGPWSVTTDRLTAYLAGRSWSAQSRRNNVKSIRVFYRWAAINGFIDADPAASVPVNLPAPAEAEIDRRRVVYPEPSAPTGPPPLSVPAAWSDLIDAWHTHARSAGLSPHTLTLRLAHLRRLGRDLHPATPADTTTADLEEWLAGHTGISNEYRRALRSSVRALFGWAADAGRLPADPARRLRVVKATTPLPRPASSQAYRDALARADDRQALALMLAAEMGLRRAEVAQVHALDVADTDDGPALTVHGKGGKRRVVPMTDRIHRAVRARQAATGAGYLFPGAIDGHLSARRIGEIVADALPAGVTMHQLRHRFATVVYQATTDVLGVQQLLGHASPATTQRYVAINPASLRASVETAAGAYPRPTAPTTPTQVGLFEPMNR